MPHARIDNSGDVVVADAPERIDGIPQAELASGNGIVLAADAEDWKVGILALELLERMQLLIRFEDGEHRLVLIRVTAQRVVVPRLFVGFAGADPLDVVGIPVEETEQGAVSMLSGTFDRQLSKRDADGDGRYVRHRAAEDEPGDFIIMPLEITAGDHGAEGVPEQCERDAGVGLFDVAGDAQLVVEELSVPVHVAEGICVVDRTPVTPVVGYDRRNAVLFEIVDEFVIPLLMFDRAVDQLEEQRRPGSLRDGDGEFKTVLGRKRQFLHDLSVL